MPGMRSRQPGMSPEKIAIAVAVTIAAMAGIGAMKKVTGTSSAVAIVAVRPGTAPTKRPNSEAPSITRMLYGSKTIAKACSQADSRAILLWRGARALHHATDCSTPQGSGTLSSL